MPSTPIPYSKAIVIGGGAGVLLILLGSLWPGVVDGDPTPKPPDPNFPIFTEVSPNPVVDQPAWVELSNQSSTLPSRLSNLRVHIPGADVIEIDVGISELPEGGHVIVCFDLVDGGPALQGCPDQADILIHAPSDSAASWLPGSGQIALLEYRWGNPDNARLVDFLAWGGPATGPLPNGDPPPSNWRDRWILLTENTGIVDSDYELAPGEGISLRPGGRPGAFSDWSVYTADELSGGESNTRGAPKFVSPPDNATIRNEDATIVWLPKPEDDNYCIRFQPVPLPNSTVTATVAWTEFSSATPYFRPFDDAGYSAGTFKYQIRRDNCGDTSSVSWSISREITLATLTIDATKVVEAGPVNYAFQRKDSPMLCLEPANTPIQGYAGCDEDHWSAIHPPLVPPRATEPPTWTCAPVGSGANFPTAPSWGRHGGSNCVRASISMLVKSYGGCLSQDRIAHEYLKNPSVSPDFDLRHDFGTNCIGFDDLGKPTGGLCTSLLTWALGFGPNSATTETTSVSDDVIEYHQPGLDFQGMIDSLEAGRPLMNQWKSTNEDHMRVIDAAYEEGADQWIRVLDPFAGGPQWRMIDADRWSSAAFATWECPPIGSAVNPVNDGERPWKDRDRDGISNYDESERFGTKEKRKDSDGDRVPDLNEVFGYVFYPTPLPNPIAADWSISDFDGDHLRKELDRDNDGDRCRDGQEDTNHNGFTDDDDRYDAFDPTDCRPASCGLFGCSCRTEPQTP